MSAPGGEGNAGTTATQVTTLNVLQPQMMFSSHSHLTIDTSKLSEILHLLVTNNNAHEGQIAELKRELSALKSSRSTSSAPTFPSPAADATLSSDVRTLKSDMQRIQLLLGTQTAEGVNAVAAFFATAKSSVEHYSCLTALPFAQAIIKQVTSDDSLRGAVTPAAEKPVAAAKVVATKQSKEPVSTDVLAIVRALETKLEQLTGAYELLRQQTQLLTAAAASTTAKSGKPMARSPSIAAPTPLVGVGGVGMTNGIDPVVRIDVERLTQRVSDLEERMRSDAMSSNNGGGGSDDVTQSRAAELASINTKVGNVIKRLEVVERTLKPGAPVSAGNGSNSPEATYEDKEPHPRRSPMISMDSAKEFVSLVRTVEDKVMNAIRQSKDNVLGVVQGQLDALKGELRGSIAQIPGCHCTAAGYREQQPNSPLPVETVEPSPAGAVSRAPPPSTKVFSPFVPSREAIMQAASMRPSSAGTTTKPCQPHEVSGSRSPHIFRLGNPSSAAVGFVVEGEQKPSTAVSPSPQKAQPPPPFHDPSTCVVYKCGWCDPSRDRAPTWSLTPPPSGKRHQ